ncbi:MAG: hypothetical protein LAO04_02280 [Acidobacteriia bacterium]|nr:hypothetical protein [Terriglobia bacterium]
MSKTMLALESFVVGAFCMFFMLSGSHTSILAQSGLGLPDAIPVVPPLSSIEVRDSHFGTEPQQLDGLNCKECTFDNVTLTYGGGAYHLENCRFSGTTRVVFTGAAQNALAVLPLIAAITSGNPNPNPPRPKETRIAQAKAPITIVRWVSPK